MSEKPYFTSSKIMAESPVFRNLPKGAGIAVFAFGVLIIVSWYAH